MNRLLTIRVLFLIVLIASANLAVAQSDAEVQEVISKFKEGDPGMQAWFKEAYGYAIFPSVGKAGIGIGGARGEGLV
ncbi:MAG: hypothetical protein ACERKR_11590, partial [Deltaproteobacteria bacterium]